MLKKLTILCLTILVFSSCLNDDGPNYTYDFLAVDEAVVPTSFTFGERDTIAIKYTLKNGCYAFDNLYYEYQDTARIVAVRAFVTLDENCPEITTQRDYDIIVNVSQREDYLFKFYKGKDADGKNIFEEVAVPVN